MSWLEPGKLRIGLGCLRLPDEPDVARATIAAAVEAGITVFDTAHAYAPVGAEPGYNERLLAAALEDLGARAGSRVVTKGGMARTGGAWIPDGRARSIRADCEASLEALGGLPIDLYLAHAPDPRTPWPTTVRALGRLLDAGLVRHVGLSNVNRDQLEIALALAPIAAVQVALSPAEDRVLRGGLLARCAELGITVIAHSPLGGPQRAGRLTRHANLAEIAAAHGATPAEVALAWLLGLSPVVVAIPGARRPESARSAARAARLALNESEHAALTRALSGPRPAERSPAPQRPRTPERSRAPDRRPARGAAQSEVVLIMGIPGAGKTRLAQEYVARGYARLNRDERGGRLRGLADALEADLAAGARRVVLDNTYLTRALRSYVIDAAAAHGVPVRCIWLRTPLAQAQVNLVARLLEIDGTLPGPEALRGRAQGVMAPTSQMRALRELEEPAREEGFAEVEVVDFTRIPGPGGAGVFVAAAALGARGLPAALAAAAPDAPHLVFDWRAGAPPGTLDAEIAGLAARVGGPVAGAVCPHGGGPPSCWCRPPLPGLVLAFARPRAIEPTRATLIGVSTAHRTLAVALGARYVTLVA